MRKEYILTCSDFRVKIFPTALVKNEASKGFKGDSDSMKEKSFSSRVSSWLIAELICGTSHIIISVELSMSFEIHKDWKILSIYKVAWAGATNSMSTHLTSPGHLHTS